MELKHIHLHEVDSTNSYLSRLGKEGGNRESLMLTTDYQEHGRGQGLKSWESEPGKNLLMSVLLFPEFLSAADQFCLSRIASLSACELLDSLGINALIKWPNDILVNGKKIAGILIENGITGKTLSHTIIGYGINLNQKDFPNFPVPATSVILENLSAVSRNEAAGKLLGILMKKYNRLSQGRVNQFEKAYLGRLYMLDRRTVFKYRNSLWEGIVRGTSPLGELLVEHGGNVEAYRFGEIEMVRSAVPRDPEN
jgi:BirA family biotin operon repressor/biotin-[acetyl-CoA-carboxylase] ligase